MIIRTLLFFVLMYFLVKIISRLFLSSGKQQRSQSRASVFYRTFQQFAEQSRQQNRNRQPSGNNTNSSQPFEEIEEAEFEDVTDDEKSTSKSPE